MNTPDTIKNPNLEEPETSSASPAASRSPNLARQLGVTVPVLLALGLGGFLIVHSRHGDAEQPAALAASPNAPITVSEAGRQAVQIQTAPVRLSPLVGRLQTTGLVSYPADQSVNISPRLQGRVRQVYVSVGDHVTAGEPLVQLDSTDAATAQTTFRENQDKLRLAAITLQRNQTLLHLGTPEVTQAEAALEQAKEHTSYTRDALNKIRLQAKIGGFNQQPLATAQTNVVQAQAALDSSKQDLDLAQRAERRAVKLNQIGVNASQDVEAAENTLSKAQVTVQSNQDQLRLAQETLAREQKAYKTNLYTDQSVRAAEDALQAAQLQQSGAVRALALARASIGTNLEQAQNGYANAQSDFQNSLNALNLLGHPSANGTVSIVSPISGVVTARNVNPGQVVDQSQETPWNMMTISSTNTVWVEGDIYEQDLASVAEGQPVAIRVDALPDRTFSGRVRHIAPALDPKTRAVKVRVEIANPNGLLKDGMFAEMTVVTGHTQAAPVVPLAAVQHDADSDYVYVASDGKYTRRNVTIGAQKGGESIITSGLRPGERVVTQGALFLGSQGSDS